MSDKFTMSQITSPPEKSPAFRSSFVILIAALLGILGLITAGFVWGLPQIEKASDAERFNNSYVSVGGFAKSKEELSPELANIYAVQEQALQATPAGIQGVWVQPFTVLYLFERPTAEPKPEDKYEFNLNEKIYFGSAAEAEVATSAFQSTYLANGYTATEQEEGKTKLTLVDTAGTPVANALFSTGDDGGRFYVQVENELTQATELSKLPVNSGSITYKQLTEIEEPNSSIDECTLTTKDGIMMPSRNGAWLEGFGCVPSSIK